jgi:hypothetical protein
MTKQKSNRVFLGIVTGAMALAGTGLTIANNVSSDFQMIAIAITLAACFSAAEVTFLWGHKRFEDSANSKKPKLWRKIVLGSSLAILVLSMGYAVFEELNLALKKISNQSLAKNSGEIVKVADARNQTRLGKIAIRELSNDKINIDPMPFVVCYIITGLVSILILSASERPQARTITYGNQLPHNPALQEAVRRIGFDPQTARAYRDNRERGHAIHVEGQYKRFVSDTELSKYS